MRYGSFIFHSLSSSKCVVFCTRFDLTIKNTRMNTKAQTQYFVRSFDLFMRSYASWTVYIYTRFDAINDFVCTVYLDASLLVSSIFFFGAGICFNVFIKGTISFVYLFFLKMLENSSITLFLTHFNASTIFTVTLNQIQKKVVFSCG